MDLFFYNVYNNNFYDYVNLIGWIHWIIWPEIIKKNSINSIFWLGKIFY